LRRIFASPARKSLILSPTVAERASRARKKTCTKLRDPAVTAASKKKTKKSIAEQAQQQG
jgi:hypothetical protein